MLFFHSHCVLIGKRVSWYFESSELQLDLYHIFSSVTVSSAFLSTNQILGLCRVRSELEQHVFFSNLSIFKLMIIGS